jgi:hypothetical protein
LLEDWYYVMDYVTEDKSMIKRQNSLWLVMAAMLALTSVNAEAKPKEAFRQVTLKNGLHHKVPGDEGCAGGFYGRRYSYRDELPQKEKHRPSFGTYDL